MRQAFVDTVAWIALLNISDGLHIPAQRVMHDLRQHNVQLVTTEFVLIEVADALALPPYVHTQSLSSTAYANWPSCTSSRSVQACLQTAGRFTASVLIKHGA